MPTTYRYFPLLTDASAIRILKLHPGSWKKKIRVTLQQVPFDEAQTPTYDALSYVWGSPENPHRIQVQTATELGQTDISQGSGQLEVTRNLAVALRHLRHEQESRTLWIDAICIDQSNLAERSQQVAIMGKIYQLARRTIIWLGPAAEDSNLALEALHELGSHVLVDWVSQKIRQWPNENPGIPWRNDGSGPLLSLGEREFDAFEAIIDRPWFERLWVYQEASLANSESVVVCGSKEIKWRAFKDALKCIHMFSSSDDLMEHTEARLDAFVSLYDISRAHSLCMSIHHTRLLQCSDGRDRVYAVLSVVTPPVDIKPDYTRTTAEVYQDMTQSWFKDMGDVSFLTFCALSGRELQCPTWVPDWSALGQPMIPCTDIRASFMYSDAEFSECGTLRISAVCYGIISKLNHVRANLDALASVNDKAPELARLCPEDLLIGTYITGCTLLEAYSGTLITHSFEDAEPTPVFWNRSLAMEIVKSFFDNKTDRKKRLSHKDIMLYLNAFSEACNNRALFFTDRGYMGIVPSWAQEEDLVYVVPGCPEPIVFRPAGNLKLQVVGPCFVYGIASGDDMLGPLPDDCKRIQKYHDGINAYTDAYRNGITGEISFEDPRVRALDIHNGVLEEFPEIPVCITVEALESIGVKFERIELV